MKDQCQRCIDAECGHIHCPKCGCTWDFECDYGGWHNDTQYRPGCYVDCPNSDCDTIHPYRPSNGTEGTMFEAALCARCEHDKEFRATETGTGCDILLRALSGEAPAEWSAVLSADGLGGQACSKWRGIDE